MKATHCPQCGSARVNGGLIEFHIILIIIGLILCILPGLIIWAVLNKGNCRECGFTWPVNAKSEHAGYLIFQHGINNKPIDKPSIQSNEPKFPF